MDETYFSDNSTMSEEFSNLSSTHFPPEDGQDKLYNNMDDLIRKLNEMSEKSSEYEGMCHLAISIADNYLWVLFAIGVPANTLTIITVLTMQGMSPASFLVVMLAIYDGAAIFTKAFYYFLFAYAPGTRSDITCKMEFISVTLATIANWMLVLICAERFISVCFPLKKISIFTKKRSYILVSAVSVFFLIFYAIIYFLMRIQDGGVCKPHSNYKEFWRKYYLVLNASFLMFIPFLMILGSAIAIIRGLVISRRIRRSLMRKSSKSETGNDRGAMHNQRLLAETERTERMITFMIVLAAIVFVILALPGVVHFFMSDYENLQGMTCSSAKITRWILFRQIQHVLIDSSHCINFFIYFLAAKRFRVHLIKLLTCKKCRKKSQKKSQETMSSHMSCSSKVNEHIIRHCPGREIA